MSQHSYSALLLANELDSLAGSDVAELMCHWPGYSVEKGRQGKQTVVNTLRHASSTSQPVPKADGPKGKHSASWSSVLMLHFASLLVFKKISGRKWVMNDVTLKLHGKAFCRSYSQTSSSVHCGTRRQLRCLWQLEVWAPRVDGVSSWGNLTASLLGLKMELPDSDYSVTSELWIWHTMKQWLSSVARDIMTV